MRTSDQRDELRIRGSQRADVAQLSALVSIENHASHLVRVRPEIVVHIEISRQVAIVEAKVPQVAVHVQSRYGCNYNGQRSSSNKANQ